MGGARDERQGDDSAGDPVRQRQSSGLRSRLDALPKTVRHALVWCAIAIVVAVIFTLTSLPAWWPT